MDEYAPYITQKLVDRGHARRMGHLENYFAMLQRQKLYTNFNTYAELSVPVGKVQLASILRPILLQYSELMHTIVPKKYPNHEEYYLSKEYLNSPCPEHDYIKVLSKVSLEDIVMNFQTEYSDITKKIADKFIDAGYKYTGDVATLVNSVCIPICDQTKPSWRLLCLPDPSDEDSWSKFVYISNHCCSDGLSSAALFKDLCRVLTENEYETLEVTEPMTIVEYAKDYEVIAKFPLPITDRVDYRPKLSALPKFFAATMVHNYLTYKSPGANTQRVDKLGVFAYDKILNFDIEQVHRMRSVIKEKVHQNCTLTPFLQLCWFVAMYRFGKIFKKSWSEWGLDIALPTNARKCLPDDKELRDTYKYGSNVGGTHYAYLISSFDIKKGEIDKFWSLVEYYNDVFTKSYQNGDEFSGLGILMMDFITKNQNVDKVISEEYCGHKRGGVLLSNLGYHPQDDSNSVHIRDMVFFQTPGSMKFTFSVNVCSTNVKGMNIALSIIRDVVKDRSEFDELARYFTDVVSEFTGM